MSSYPFRKVRLRNGPKPQADGTSTSPSSNLWHHPCTPTACSGPGGGMGLRVSAPWQEGEWVQKYPSSLALSWDK